MDRALLEGNRLVNQRQLMINKAFYKSKITKPVKAINNSPPYAFQLNLNKSSKLFILEGTVLSYN